FKLIHHPETGIEIVDGAHVLDALADVGRAAGRFRQKPKNLMWEKMAERIDVAHGKKAPVRSTEKTRIHVITRGFALMSGHA
ncbi:MAG: hypothetical protein WCA56_10820, partial [Xanthobacteraceae bacterium]